MRQETILKMEEELASTKTGHKLLIVLLLSAAVALGGVITTTFTQLNQFTQSNTTALAGEPRSPTTGDFVTISRQPAKGLFWNSLTKGWLSAEQMILLRQTYEIGHSDADEAHALLLQGVLLQETIAGQLGRIGDLAAPVGKRSYGVMQVKVTAARDVLRHHKDEFERFRSDEELIAHLITDDRFNIRIASKLLQRLHKKTLSPEKALVAYNVGLRASRNIKQAAEFKYVQRVQQNIQKVATPFNKRFLSTPLRLAMR